MTITPEFSQQYPLWSHCPICLSKNIVEIEPGIQRCQNCTHGFRADILQNLKPRYLQRLYWEQDKNRQGITTVEPGAQYQEWLDDRIGILSRFHVLDFGPSNFRILEFGCAEGMLLFELKKPGYDVMGEEVGEIAGEGIKNLGLNISREPIEEFVNSGEKFDLIMSYHVVEHLRDPRNLFDKLCNLLNPEGMLLLHVPIDDNEFGNRDRFHFFTDASCIKLMGLFTADIKTDYTFYDIEPGVSARSASYLGIRK